MSDKQQQMADMLHEQVNKRLDDLGILQTDPIREMSWDEAVAEILSKEDVTMCGRKTVDMFKEAIVVWDAIYDANILFED